MKSWNHEMNMMKTETGNYQVWKLRCKNQEAGKRKLQC